MFLRLLYLASLLGCPTGIDVLGNEYLRFGTGSTDSVNANGILQQPFLYTNGAWSKLTFSNYALSSVLKVDGTEISLSSASATIDTTGLSSGTGTITATTTHSSGAATLTVVRSYTLVAASRVATVQISVSVSGGTINNVKMWYGTKND
jgi:hypothetical protein